MFGIGIQEFLLIFVVALVIFGPDRLPDFARQAGRMVRQVRQLSRQARDDIRAELGPEYADFELTDLDPRRALRKHISEVWDEDDPDHPDRVAERQAAPHSTTEEMEAAGLHSTEGGLLGAGELPPYDADAT